MSASAEAGILEQGRNAWRVTDGTRATVLVDAADYFKTLEVCLPRARRSIWIIGWDFNGDIKLDPTAGEDAESLGALLRRLVEENTQLEVRVLVWSLAYLYSQKKLRRREVWSDHPRIFFTPDSKHPLGASHHQKLVCVDDTVAFAGGIDLTTKRWDTCEHAADNPYRQLGDGTTYFPVHDVQIALEGDVARALGDLARVRWKAVTGETIPHVEDGADCWPPDLKPDFENFRVGVARTTPSLLRIRKQSEVARLNADALRRADRYIYIETQYFASRRIANILASRLREEDGPDVVVLVTRSSRGFLERVIMGGNRDRLIRKLGKADKFGRLRVMYPEVPSPNGSNREVLIHAKVLVTDDRFIRIGSSNLNNRSAGLDTECDVAIEATTAEQRATISRLRNQLLAEHLDADPARVNALSENVSLSRIVDRLNTRERGLRPFKVGDGETATIVGTALVDPKMPFWSMQKIMRRAKKVWQSGKSQLRL